MKRIKVALLGLGEVGEKFAEHLLEQIQEHRAPVQIVAVADRHAEESPVAIGFSQNGAAVFKDALDVAKLGDQIDIIFDLTGSSRIRQELKLRLIELGNTHTTIATEAIAQLLWCFFNEPTPLSAAA